MTNELEWRRRRRRSSRCRQSSGRQTAPSGTRCRSRRS